MNWWNVVEVVIGGSLIAAVTSWVSFRLFYPTLKIPKNSLWERLKLRLGWRWDYLLQASILEANVRNQHYSQVEIRLPVTNVGGRSAEQCTLEVLVKRLPEKEFILKVKEPTSDIGSISGYHSIFHNPQWLDSTKPNPQSGFGERDVAPGYIAWFSFVRIYVVDGDPIADFYCPGEYSVRPSEMAIRLRESEKPLNGLITVHSKNTMPTRCYFTFRNRKGRLELALSRMSEIRLGAIGVWFPVPIFRVIHRFNVSDLTGLPG